MALLGGHVSVVAGGAGGIGAALAAALAGEGATVVVLDLASNRLEAVGRSIAPSGLCIAVDLADEDSVGDALGKVGQRYGRLDSLINTMGVFEADDFPVPRLSLAVWQRNISANLTAPYLTCKHAIPILVDSGGGSIVNIGSPTGLVGGIGAGHPAYSATKAGMMALTRVIAADHASAGVRANVVIPGTVRTAMTARVLADPAVGRNLAERIPLGRIGEPSDLVGIVLYLVSAASAYATGATFAVDGGLLNS